LDNRQPPLILAGLILLTVIALAGLIWGNYQYAQNNPGGNDFLPRYLGTRLFMVKGQSPYSEATTQEIQKMVYGRPAEKEEDQVLFVYPFYSFLIFAPFALIKNYVLARAVWMTVLEISLFLLAGIGISLSRWRISRSMLVVILIFTALWYHSVRVVINGNASVLCALFLAAAFLAIRSEHDVLGGFLIALASIKPQMVVLLIPFVLIWASSQRRWLLFWSLLVSLGFLIATTVLLIPDWIWQNLVQIVAYPSYTQPGSPGAIFYQYLPGIGKQMGWVITVFTAGILFWEWRVALHRDYRWFLWTAYLTLVLTNLIGIRTATENYIALFPALIMVLAVWDERWGISGRWLIITSVLLLLVGLWWLFLATLRMAANQPTQHPIMFFPLPIFLLIGLYWTRWWAVRPPPPILEQLRSTESADML
jgi:hypothetical protein